MSGASGWYPGRCRDCASEELVGARCQACNARHNAASRQRRAALKAKRRCTVCGDQAVKVAGKWLTTCEVHREYFRARAARG